MKNLNLELMRNGVDVSACALAIEERSLLSKLIKGLFFFGFIDQFDSKKEKIIACFTNFIFSALLITCLVLLVLYFSINLSIYALVIACLGIALESIVFGVLYYNFKKVLYEKHRGVIFCCTCPDKGDKQVHYSDQQVEQAYRLNIKSVKELKNTKHIRIDQITKHCSGCTDREYSRPIFCCACPDKGDKPFHFSYQWPKQEYCHDVK